MQSDRGAIQRFTIRERLVHWTVGFGFVYLMLTGLSLFSPHLFWLSYVLGGGMTIARWHPIIGVIFSAALVWMFVMWLGNMKFEARTDNGSARSASTFAMTTKDCRRWVASTPDRSNYSGYRPCVESCCSCQECHSGTLTASLSGHGWSASWCMKLPHWVPSGASWSISTWEPPWSGEASRP